MYSFHLDELRVAFRIVGKASGAVLLEIVIQLLAGPFSGRGFASLSQGSRRVHDGPGQGQHPRLFEVYLRGDVSFDLWLLVLGIKVHLLLKYAGRLA